VETLYNMNIQMRQITQFEKFEKFERLLGTDNPLLKSVKQRGFEEPTEIQEKSIPAILNGKDVIAGASTGSGKTLAFAAGLIKNAREDYGVQGLILTPTRELAEQVAEELSDFSRFKNLDVIPVYGGVSIHNQIKRLNYAEIVVGTPGRILDHINRNSINLSQVNTLVLDEADRMLDMGFRDDVKKIISNCPNKKQTLLFSATISDDIAKLIENHMKDPVEILAEPHVDPDKLEQIYYDAGDNLKYSLLKYLLENEKARLVMIFCNTRKNVDFVANNLKFMGIEALPIHGGFSQDKRTKIMNYFHSEKIHVLVATNVAARGLDINWVSHVYNYDIPPTAEEYIHRIGRTARAGKEGKVINILGSRDYDNFRTILKSDFKIQKKETPYIERVRIRWMPEKRNERGDRRSTKYRENNPGDSNHRHSSYKPKSYSPRSRESNSRYSNNEHKLHSYSPRGRDYKPNSYNPRSRENSSGNSHYKPQPYKTKRPVNKQNQRHSRNQSRKPYHKKR